MRTKLLLIAILLFPVYVICSQDRIISGQVTDAITGEGIPFVSIGLTGSSRGTLTNELGYFSMKFSGRRGSVIFSHVGYKREVVSIPVTSEPLSVKLELAFVLDNVLVTAKDNSELYKILKKAITRTRQQMRTDKFGRAFYRQLSQNDSTHNELYEIFYDSRFDANGISDWSLQDGRYALRDNSAETNYVYNKNFTLINRLFPTLQPKTDLFITPMREDLEEFYELGTSKVIEQEGRQVAVIEFSPIKEAVGPTPAFAGEIYIDLENFNVLNYSGSFESNNLKVITFNSMGGEVDEYNLHFETNFRFNGDGELLLDYIKTQQEFEVVYSNGLRKSVETNSLFTIYEYYTPERRNRRLGGRLFARKSDRELIEEVSYDAEFWRQNPIVRRTPIENSVIEDFESDQKFGSIFINNRNQVSFMPQLDGDSTIMTLKRNLGSNVPIYEKVYLHFDRASYATGQDAWFKAYIVDGQRHLPMDRSGVLNLELISPKGEVIVQEDLEIKPGGLAFGDFKIKRDWVTGKYLVRTYTDRMSNFDSLFYFTRHLDIYTDKNTTTASLKDNKPAVTFFPEGGHLVYGLPSRLAFKAIDINGEPIKISGSIVDNEGNLISALASQHEGMGSVFFKPDVGKNYEARISYGTEQLSVNLPNPVQSGLVMGVRNDGIKNITVRVLASSDFEGKELYLVGHTRGKMNYKSKGKVEKQVVSFEIPLHLVPTGILHLTVFDQSLRPFAERLTFVNKDDFPTVKIRSNRRRYGKRERIELSLGISDDYGNPITSLLSLSVLDADQVRLNEIDESIASYLLLSSDLSGPISRPQSYLNGDQNTVRALDLIMLTNGWRRFTWQTVNNVKTESSYPFISGLTLCGRLKHGQDRKKYANHELNLIALGSDASFYTTTSDDKGDFCFTGTHYTDSSSLVVQTTSANGRPIDLEVEFKKESPKLTNYRASAGLFRTNDITDLINVNNQRIAEQLALGDDYQLLEEVVVEGQASQGPGPSQTIIGTPDYTVDFDEEDVQQPDVLSVIQGKVPGLQITFDGVSSRVRITGGTAEPLYLLDGMPVNTQAFSGQRTVNISSGPGGQVQQIQGTTFTQDDFTLHQFLRTISPQDIDRVEVMKGPNAAIYGSRGMNGVIAIYTKKGYAPLESVSSTQFKGFYLSREFYAPDYGTVNPEITDRRATLFWKPDLETDEEGGAQISFYNSDIAESMTVLVEGIGSSGQPISAIYQINPRED